MIMIHVCVCVCVCVWVGGWVCVVHLALFSATEHV